jgi:hypothetical protein
MNITGKFAVVLVLLTGLSVFSFADTFYGFSVGAFRFNEQFGDEYGRELDGLNFSIDISHFPGKSPIGWFIHGSAGASFSAYEWTEDSMSSLDVYSLTDLRLSIGPVLKIVSGSKVAIPISLGPSIANYHEEDNSYDASVYETVNIGFFADVAVFFIPVRWLFLKTGISASWDFMQFERKGIQFSNRKNFFEDNSYNALNIGLYYGIGIRFQ